MITDTRADGTGNAMAEVVPDGGVCRAAASSALSCGIPNPAHALPCF
jgi:hypothetical protein